MSMRAIAVVCGVCAAMVALPSAGQHEARAAGPEAVAKAWAKELFDSLTELRRETGDRVALQPLDPDKFAGLTARQRRQLYEWLQQAFGKAVRGRYDLVDPASLPDISRILESTSAREDWLQSYKELLRNAKARINVVCTGNPKGELLDLNCSALDISDSVRLAQASAQFRMDWLSAPVGLGPAVGLVAEEVLNRLAGTGRIGRFEIVDGEGEETRLAKYVAGRLRNAVAARNRQVGGNTYRLKGEIQIFKDLILDVSVFDGDVYLTSASEKILLSSVPAALLRSDDKIDGDAGAAVGWAKEARELKPGAAFWDCPECPEMVVVASGSFAMESPASEAGRDGGEGPQRRVRISKPFAAGKYEVTFAEWNACASEGGCGGYWPDDAGWGRVNRPVINVSWEDAKRYVEWLSRKTGKEYRLLSESEWEYAAGPEPEHYTTSFVGKTKRVGSFASNGFGLHDMYGNVWEWVEDCHGSYVSAPSDGRAWESGGCRERVLRGGSWDNNPRYLRSADRVRNETGNRINNFGFRVARTLAP